MCDHDSTGWKNIDLAAALAADAQEEQDRQRLLGEVEPEDDACDGIGDAADITELRIAKICCHERRGYIQPPIRRSDINIVLWLGAGCRVTTSL